LHDIPPSKEMTIIKTPNRSLALLGQGHFAIIFYDENLFSQLCYDFVIYLKKVNAQRELFIFCL